MKRFVIRTTRKYGGALLYVSGKRWVTGQRPNQISKFKTKQDARDYFNKLGFLNNITIISFYFKEGN